MKAETLNVNVGEGVQHESQSDWMHDVKTQLRLAMELYKEENPGTVIDSLNKRYHDIALMNWANKPGFSEFYRKLVQDALFEHHPRLKGNVDNITLADVKYYILNQSFLKE